MVTSERNPGGPVRPQTNIQFFVIATPTPVFFSTKKKKKTVPLMGFTPEYPRCLSHLSRSILFLLLNDDDCTLLVSKPPGLLSLRNLRQIPKGGHRFFYGI